MRLIPYFWNLVLLDCYRNKMDAKDKEFYDIVFKNCTEEEIYAILLKKKETRLSSTSTARSNFGI